MKAYRVVACASLLAVAGNAGAAKAEVSSEISTDKIKADLRQAICYQDWDKAAETASLLIASATITPEYRQTLVDWRHRFSNYASANTKFDHIPDCEGIARSVAATPPPSAGRKPETANLAQDSDLIKENLRQAICYQDWNKAAEAASLLIASPTTSPQQRQNLVTWRHRFTNYAATNTKFDQIPNCEGIAATVPVNRAPGLSGFNRPDETPKVTQNTDLLKENLREAICHQDWNKAAETASLLIASPATSPEHRQNLVTWRHRFSEYATSNAKFDRIPNCRGVAPANDRQTFERSFATSTPRFSTYSQPTTTGQRCYWVTPQGQTVSLETMCNGNASSKTTQPVGR